MGNLDIMRSDAAMTNLYEDLSETRHCELSNSFPPCNLFHSQLVQEAGGVFTNFRGLKPNLFNTTIISPFVAAREAEVEATTGSACMEDNLSGSACSFSGRGN